MGADLYLESITHTQDANEIARSPAPKHLGPVERIEYHFDVLRACGGYFRNGYNAGDVMYAMGMSWDDVGRMLDDEYHLPIACARELLATIKERPMTRERVARHVLENMMDGKHGDPATAWVQDIMQDITGEDQKPAPPDIDELHGFLSKRYGELVAILEKSIELNEPLLCSL
jgi:hypothetical protein